MPTFEVDVAEPEMVRPESVVVELPPFEMENATFEVSVVEDAITNDLSEVR